MKKKVLFGILIAIVLAVAAYFVFYHEDSNVYTGTATIVKSPSFKKVIAEITNDEDKVVGEADIYSSIFGTGDKMKVEYTKKGLFKYNITKIEAITDTVQDKLKAISSIRKNVVPLRDYREMITVSADISEMGEENDTISPTDIYALPKKISGQDYVVEIGPNEFFEIMHDIHKVNPVIDSNLDVEVTFDTEQEFKILSFESVVNDENAEDVTYTLNDNGFSFESIEHDGVYYLRVEFENGDIVDYIFA